MESLQVTLGALQEAFAVRMMAFENDLKKSRTQSPTIDSLASEFDSFRTFIIATLKTIQQQVAAVARDNDALEMRSRRNILLLHGVPEHNDEDTKKTFMELANKHLVLPQLSAEVVGKSVRLGRPSKDRPRPLLVKFNSETMRDSVWYAKAGFKGTGVTVSEFLTKIRHSLFMAAREQLGVTNCWTRAGRIIALDSDGKRHVVTSLSDISKLKPGSSSKPHDTDTGVSTKEQPALPGSKNKRAISSRKK